MKHQTVMVATTVAADNNGFQGLIEVVSANPKASILVGAVSAVGTLLLMRSVRKLIREVTKLIVTFNRLGELLERRVKIEEVERIGRPKDGMLSRHRIWIFAGVLATVASAAVFWYLGITWAHGESADFIASAGW